MTTFAALALLILTGAAQAAPLDSAKLDGRARVALARLRAGSPAAALRADAVAVTREGELDVFIRGDVSRATLESAGVRVRTALPGLFTASVPLSAIDAVLALPGVRSVRGSAPAELEIDASVPSTGVANQRGAGPGFAGGLNGAGVVLGDVDSGVDYNHGDFVDAGVSRFVSIWDQTVAGVPPAGFGYGTEWSNAQLTAGVATETDVDGHGTHVLGIAGGDGSQTGGAIPAHTYTGMAPKSDLIMVKTTFGTTDILDGVAYIFNKAAALGKPAVANLSLGSQYGPHDGKGDFEAGLSALTGLGRIVVKSAGNDRGAARHAEVFATFGPTNITMSVGTSVTGRVIALDGYYESTENLSVTITTPNSTVIGPILLGNVNAGYPGTSTANGYVYLENGAFLTPDGDREVYIELAALVAGQNLNGTWTFTFTPVAVGAALGEVDLWRFYSNGGTANFVTGSQPFEELISEPGNADSAITVGAHVSKVSWIACTGAASTFSGTPPVGTLAPFSSPGPTRSGGQKPDLTAPGIAIGSTRSFDVAGLSCPVSGPSTLINDGSNHIVNAGTSMAAPHVSGAAALLMQFYGPLYPSQIKEFLTANALVDGNTGAVWNKDWGHGKLRIPDLFAPTPTVLAPNGGESIEIGTATNVTWSATDLGGGVTSVDLHLSRDGGGSFEAIALGVANTGSYMWLTTGPYTANALVRVTARDAASNSGEDLSNAAFLLHHPVGVGDGPARAFALGRPAPSPTTGAANVTFALPRAASVRLSLFDIQGREVAVLASGQVEAGDHQVAWDGRIGAKRAPAGLYFVRFQTPERVFVERLVVAQ